MAAFGKSREFDVVVKGSRLGFWACDLAPKYSKAAESASGKAKEASALLSVAEGYTMKEEAEAALKAATDALAMFRELGDKVAIADALMLVVHVSCCMGKASEAATMAKDELWRFKDAADKVGEAKMQLSLAGAHLGGPDGAEQASAEVTEALRGFRGSGDKTMIGAALVCAAAIQFEKKGDAKRRADEAKQACDEALSIFRELGNVKGEALVLHSMGTSRALSGASEGALRAVKESQGLFMKAEMPKQAAFEMQQAAVWHLKDNDLDDALAAALEALDIFEDDMKASNGEASVVQTLVQIYIEQRDVKSAMKLAKYELDRFQETGNSKGEAAAQELIMLCYFELDNADRAMRYAERAADTLEGMGDKKGQARLLRTMCSLHRAKGSYDKALKVAQEALNVFEDQEDVKEQAITLQARADVYLAKGEHGRALALASEARELYSDARYVEGEVKALLQLSAAQFAEGDHKKAAASAREAQDKSTEVQDQAGEAAALKALIEVHYMEKEYDAALRVLGSLLTLVKEMGDREEEVITMVLNCRVLLYQIMQKEEDGKSNEKMYKATADKASKMAKEAVSIARKLGSPAALGTALFTMGQTSMMSGKPAEATKAVDESVKVFSNAGIENGEAASLTLLADINLYNRNIGKARELAEEAVWLSQKIVDTDGEDFAWTELERIEKVEGEIREEELRQEQMRQQYQMQQWAMSQGGQMPLMSQPQEAQEEAAPSAAAGGAGYEAKLMKLDVSSGLDPTVLKNQILEVTKGLIGYDEDIEYDNPLMESGLTSNTAVLLRDALTTQLPGVNLPVTLVFDYPSISAMSELIVENAAKAAKKAKKAVKG